VASSLGISKGKTAKLVLSGAIIAFSIAGAWLVIDASKATQSYLVTKQDMGAGSALLPSNLETAELSLFDIGDNYLKVGELPPGSYLARSVSAGEAIPRSVVTTQSLDDWSNLVITPSVELSGGIGPGSKVFVWASPALDYQSYGEPAILAIDVEVVEVRVSTGAFSQNQKSVEIRVPVDSLQSLLWAIANGDAMAITSSGPTLAD
jgi:hypothetical protein